MVPALAAASGDSSPERETLCDNGYTRNDNKRKNRWRLEGSVPLGAETHVRGRFRFNRTVLEDV